MLKFSQRNGSILGRRFYADGSHNYQKTLLLPRTKFSNRSNLNKIKVEILPRCSDELYEKQYKEFMERYNGIGMYADKVKFLREKLFVLQDGPPYANGDLHFGHALNKILKDIILRYQLLFKNKYVFYRPGWDCHGLPIELKALKNLDIEDYENISALKIRSMARKLASKTVEKQIDQFKNFGILSNWKDKYITMNLSYELHQLNVFKAFFEKGYIKRQNKPVYWGTETRTALAEGELEYNEKHESIAAYVKFPLVKNSISFLNDSLKINVTNIKCLIWTTTPWTLLSNRAICFNKKYNYKLIKLNNSTQDEHLIVCSTLLDSVVDDFIEVTEFPGKLLQNLFYFNPLLKDNVSRPLLNGKHVSDAAGTGLVHTAPGHGHDDYNVGIKNNLEIYSPVDHKGHYILNEIPSHLHALISAEAQDQDEKEPSLQPSSVLDNNTATKIVSYLKELGMLHKSNIYVHSYPYDWRSKKPVIIRSTSQWFADLSEVKENAIKSFENIEFYPKRGENRLNSFIKGRSEWCISRQRYWGVPIPAFYKKDDPSETLMTLETIQHVIEVINKKGTDAWFANSKEDGSDMKEWLPESYHDVAHEYVRGKDTMDVWFDSGTAWTDTVEFYLKTLNIKLEDIPSPLTDMYLEGSDQHRGWFQSSLLTKVAYSGKPIAPFKSLVTHGFTLDEKGVKMSKSIGNTISPKSIIEGDENMKLPSLGVDGLRYLVAQSNFTNDIVAGPVVMQHVAEAMKKLRLTFRFLLGNLENSPFTKVEYNELRRVDQYMIHSLSELLTTTTQQYQSLNFSKVLTSVQYHLNNYLSAFYFDICKDSLYSDSINSLRRKQIQTTLYHIFDTYRFILFPITPILVQEAYSTLPKQWHEVFDLLSVTNVSPKLVKDLALSDSFKYYELTILEEFQKQYKMIEGDEITKTSQTSVNMYLHDNISNLPFTSQQLEDILQTSSVNIQVCKSNIAGIDALKIKDIGTVQIEVKKSTLHKCPRCWKLNSIKDGALCHRCENSISSE